MKIVFFDDQRNVQDVLEDVLNPEPVSPREIRWYGGGMGGIHWNYVILEDNVEFSDLSEWDILMQLKEQHLFEITAVFEDLRIAGQVYGYRQQHNKLYQQTRERILQATNLEEIRVETMQFLNREFPKPPELQEGYVPPMEEPLEEPNVGEPAPDEVGTAEEEPVIRFVNEE